jgi:hypothetical protein
MRKFEEKKKQERRHTYQISDYPVPQEEVAIPSQFFDCVVILRSLPSCYSLLKKKECLNSVYKKKS